MTSYLIEANCQIDISLCFHIVLGKKSETRFLLGSYKYHGPTTLGPIREHFRPLDLNFGICPF